MKKFLLIWVVSLIWLISFSNAQWNTDLTFSAWDLPTSLTNTVFSDDTVVCKSDWWANWQFYSQVRFSAYYGNWNMCANSYSVSLSPYDYSNLKQAIYSKKPDKCDGRIDILNTSQWLLCTVTSSKMPVSALSPVVTWITDVLWEFIPYVIYIWLWVLVVSIAFVAVKRLMLWIYNKVKFIFKKR